MPLSMPKSGVAAAVMWRSLGGFGAAAPPSSSEVLLHRRAFDAIDTNGDGSISVDELAEALFRVHPEVMGSSDQDRMALDAQLQELVAHMMEVADVDKSGELELAELTVVMQR